MRERSAPSVATLTRVPAGARSRVTERHAARSANRRRFSISLTGEALEALAGLAVEWGNLSRPETIELLVRERVGLPPFHHRNGGPLFQHQNGGPPAAFDARRPAPLGLLSNPGKTPDSSETPLRALRGR